MGYLSAAFLLKEGEQEANVLPEPPQICGETCGDPNFHLTHQGLVLGMGH